MAAALLSWRSSPTGRSSCGRRRRRARDPRPSRRLAGLLGLAPLVPSVGLLALVDLAGREGIAVEVGGRCGCGGPDRAVLVLADVGRREADA